ncbi:EamA family transporter [Rhodovulum sulfidophilum]|uniref:DMT family transporter n=1 Tax=Rhodovulum visakhapatnamense TaxID=364297 RepID=A0ABS1RLR6_9RHOB|nr:DMT family transporter [Rhodovulum visakhapatnamense]MBL3568568.1 DMT family transporter [Rhodovulum visakhapatnamense]MBL3580079.1 DMT family transporter [Rhodovulum visakhapatnamense]OLS43863.1 EamA family transporter [Rhodovulum sulfidophilum]
MALSPAAVPRGAALRGHLAMLSFSALVAGSFSFGSLIANDIDPVALTALRFLLAGVLIGAAAALGPGLRRRQFRAPWRFLVLGTVFALYFVLMFEGLKTAAPVPTAAVFTLTPVMSAGFGWLFLRQRATPQVVAALAIGGAGAVWVIFRADLGALLRFEIGRGEAVFFIGCIAHAAYTPLVRKLNRGEPALVFTFGMMLAALLVLTLYGAPALVATDWGALPPLVWAVLAYLAVCASAMTFVLLQYAALRLPAAKVMAYTYLTPSWVILWEFALGHGAPRALVLGGVALTVLALAMLLKDD